VKALEHFGIVVVGSAKVSNGLNVVSHGMKCENLKGEE
jgi:hypothetical protein